MWYFKNETLSNLIVYTTFVSIFVIESSAPAEANRYKHMCKLENVELVEKQPVDPLK